MTAPIDGYEQMTVGEVEDAVDPYTNGLDSIQDTDVLDRLDLLNEILEHERSNKDRKTAKESITEVRDEVREEASSRDILTQEEEDDHERETSDGDEDEEAVADDGGETEDEDDTVFDHTTEGTDEDGGLTSDEDEDVDDEEAVITETDEEAADVDEIETIEGADGTTRILVRNADRVGKRAAGFSFDAGEVKDVVLNDQVRGAIRRNELQVVRG